MYRLALGVLFGPLIFTAVVVLASLLREDYSHVTQFVSELGATSSSRAGLMNYLGFVPGGLGLVAFGIALGRRPSKSRTTRAATSLLVFFGAGVAASGIISCDPGCPQGGGSRENFVHDKIGPVSFLCAIVATGLLGLSFRREPGRRGFSVYSVSTSLVAFCFLILLAGSLETRALTGFWQRLLVAALFSWCAIVGLRVYRLGPAAPHAV